MTDTASAAPSDADILALNAGEIYFSESPSKYPEAGHGTQYHAGTPGVLGFARAVLAKLGQPTPPAVVEPLTDGQIKAIHQELCGTIGSWYGSVARAVEAAHGIGIKKENGNG